MQKLFVFFTVVIVALVVACDSGDQLPGFSMGDGSNDLNLPTQVREVRADVGADAGSGSEEATVVADADAPILDTKTDLDTAEQEVEVVQHIDMYETVVDTEVIDDSKDSVIDSEQMETAVDVVVDLPEIGPDLIEDVTPEQEVTPECETDSDCDDESACSVDHCVAGQCVYGWKSDCCEVGADCESSSDTCQATLCVGAAQAIWCWDGKECEEDCVPTCHEHFGLWSPELWRWTDHPDAPPPCGSVDSKSSITPDPEHVECCISGANKLQGCDGPNFNPYE